MESRYNTYHVPRSFISTTEKYGVKVKLFPDDTTEGLKTYYIPTIKKISSREY